MTSRKIVLIGQAPSKTGDPSRPLATDKLAAMCGLTKKQYLGKFRRMNVFDAWPGKNGKGDVFPLASARVRAMRLVNKLTRKKIIFVGIKTAEAFGFKHAPLKWRRFNGGAASILPHPSGINRWYNDRSNVRQARRFMRTISKQAKKAARSDG